MLSIIFPDVDENSNNLIKAHNFLIRYEIYRKSLKYALCTTAPSLIENDIIPIVTENNYKHKAIIDVVTGSKVQNLVVLNSGTIITKEYLNRSVLLKDYELLYPSMLTLHDTDVDPETIDNIKNYPKLEINHRNKPYNTLRPFDSAFSCHVKTFELLLQNLRDSNDPNMVLKTSKLAGMAFIRDKSHAIDLSGRFN